MLIFLVLWLLINFNNESDLDILINFKPEITDPLKKGQLMWDLQFAIEDVFHRNVDLLQETTPKNHFFIKELQETKYLTGMTKLKTHRFGILL
jgi:predicted nucleotidyltransferase